MSFVLKHQTVSALVFFAILTALFYGNTLASDFVLDDIDIIQDNIYVHSLSYIDKAFTSCLMEYHMGTCKDSTRVYHPLQTLSYLLSWQIGSGKPWAFHLINLFLHWACTALLFIFIRMITKRAPLAALASALFIVHPVNSEVVNWPAAISEPLMMLGTLGTLIFFFRWRRQGNATNLLLMYFSYVVAMMGKEPAGYSVPLLVFALDILALKTPLARLFNWSGMKLYGGFALLFLLFMGTRAIVLGGQTVGAFIDSPLAILFPRDIFVFFVSFAFSVKQLIFPTFQFIRDLYDNPHLFSGIFFLSLTVFGILILLAFCFWNRKQNVAAFAFAWVFILYLQIPLYFILTKGMGYFYDRYLYGSAAGFAFAMALTAEYLWTKKNIFPRHTSRFFLLWIINSRALRRNILAGCAVILLGISCFVIIRRNSDWKDNIVFYKSLIVESPQTPTFRGFLADEYRKRGDWETARQEYESILHEFPDYWERDKIYANLGEYWRLKGDMTKAAEMFRNAAKIAQSYKSLNNAGVFFMQQGQYLEAVQDLCRAVLLENQAPEPQANIQHFISLLNGLDKKQLGQLVREIQTNDIFQKGKDDIVEYKDTTCANDSCGISFSAHFSEQDVVLPFFIFASYNDTAALATNPSFDPQTGTVSLQMPLAFKEKGSIFVFPTCQGIYYEVKTS